MKGFDGTGTLLEQGIGSPLSSRRWDEQGKLQNPLLEGKWAVAPGIGSHKALSSLAGARGAFKKVVLGLFLKEFLEGETSLLCPFPWGMKSLI